jgi:hypothetical protein
MPLPFAPLVPIALRVGLVAGSVWAVRRAVRQSLRVGRTDQRAEDALDDLDEGLAVHKPADRARDGMAQTNTAARFTRSLRFAGRTYDIDAAVLGRFRIKKR